MHIKLHIVHTYRILATQIINIFYHTYILLYYQNLKCTLNKIILDFALQRFVADIATRHYHTSKLTPQVQKINTTSRLGTKTISIQAMIGIVSSSSLWHENRLLKFWTESMLYTIEICWLPKSKKLELIVPQQKLRHEDMTPCNRQHN